MQKTTEVQEDECGNLVIEFDPSTLKQMGWHEGDVLEWFIKDDGVVCIEKKRDLEND
jgi:formylmethanofuran dehydrogenase subunit D